MCCGSHMRDWWGSTDFRAISPGRRAVPKRLGHRKRICRRQNSGQPLPRPTLLPGSTSRKISPPHESDGPDLFQHLLPLLERAIACGVRAVDMVAQAKASVPDANASLRLLRTDQLHDRDTCLLGSETKGSELHCKGSAAGGIFKRFMTRGSDFIVTHLGERREGMVNDTNCLLVPVVWLAHRKQGSSSARC